MKLPENFIFNKKRWHKNNCLREDETANVFLITSNVFVTRLIIGQSVLSGDFKNIYADL